MVNCLMHNEGVQLTDEELYYTFIFDSMAPVHPLATWLSFHYLPDSYKSIWGEVGTKGKLHELRYWCRRHTCRAFAIATLHTLYRYTLRLNSDHLGYEHP